MLVTVHNKNNFPILCKKKKSGLKAAFKIKNDFAEKLNCFYVKNSSQKVFPDLSLNEFFLKVAWVLLTSATCFITYSINVTSMRTNRDWSPLAIDSSFTSGVGEQKHSTPLQSRHKTLLIGKVHRLMSVSATHEPKAFKTCLIYPRNAIPFFHWYSLAVINTIVHNGILDGRRLKNPIEIFAVQYIGL